LNAKWRFRRLQNAARTAFDVYRALTLSVRRPCASEVWWKAQSQTRVNPTDPRPTCEMCPGIYIPLIELEGYAKKALAEKLLIRRLSMPLSGFSGS